MNFLNKSEWPVKKTIESLSNNFLIASFGLSKVPMIFYVGASVVELTQKRTLVKVPFKKRNKNHLNSLYFGALCVGADVAGGIYCMKEILHSKHSIQLAFKDFKANFLKRAQADTIFECKQNKLIKQALQRTLLSGERECQTLKISAYTPIICGGNPVAEFELTLAVKYKK